MKKYKLGLILGRFQIFHIGHEDIINKSLENCENTLILIGSSDKENTFINPFSFEFRKNIINEIYGDNVIIRPLNDLGIGNVPSWGDYVINSAIKYYGMPDCIIYGEEDKCKNWYSNYPNLNYIRVSRNNINISSTLLKKYILEDNYLMFTKYVNPKLYKYYNEYKSKLISLNN